MIEKFLVDGRLLLLAVDRHSWRLLLLLLVGMHGGLLLLLVGIHGGLTQMRWPLKLL